MLYYIFIWLNTITLQYYIQLLVLYHCYIIVSYSFYIIIVLYYLYITVLLYYIIILFLFHRLTRAGPHSPCPVELLN